MPKTTPASFGPTTKTEKAQIKAIVERAFKESFAKGAGAAVKQSAEMDITACHCSGNPLDLEKFLAFDDANFSHDFNGIRQNISRRTGELQGSFSPRCTKKETQAFSGKRLISMKGTHAEEYAKAIDQVLMGVGTNSEEAKLKKLMQILRHGQGPAKKRTK